MVVLRFRDRRIFRYLKVVEVIQGETEDFPVCRLEPTNFEVKRMFRKNQVSRCGRRDRENEEC